MRSARNHRIDEGRRAIRAQKPYDVRRETVWQYQDRLAAAVVDALFPEPADRGSDDG